MTTYPHIPEAWLDAFVGQSRLLGYSGAAIGAALADVDEFSSQSGETPDEAFGDARAYATRSSCHDAASTRGRPRS